jgi:radical SAM protein (TIGR04043 family)
MKTLDFPTALSTRKQWLLSELQSSGLRIGAAPATAPSRTGGAGPTDHKAVTLLGTTIMVPIHTRGAAASPFSAGPVDERGLAPLYQNDEKIGVIQYPPEPEFYRLATADGIPYWKIAQLHSRRVLATTLLQTCIRYGNESTKCQFCAIGESLKAGRTIREKSPAQLAEVAAAAKRLDGIEQVIITTGTPPTSDRGAALLAEAARAIKQATGLPIQIQCEPPDDFAWFPRLRDAGVDALGMHLEAWDESVRQRIMPGKAEVPRSYYMQAFEAAVKIFGRGQVSTYLLAGLGDTREGLLDAARQLIAVGVYPFIVPFVPVTGTQLAGHPPPSADFMTSVLAPVGRMLADAGMTSETVKAGCAKCAACSSLSAFEKPGSSRCPTP